MNHSTVNNLGRESVFAEEMKGKRNKTAQGGFRRKVNPEKTTSSRTIKNLNTTSSYKMVTIQFRP